MTVKNVLIRRNIITIFVTILPIVIGIFSFVTVFFWWGFEQAGGSMTIFANDYTNRDLAGTGALIFKIINSLLTIVPMVILTIILYMLFINFRHEFLL